MQRVEDARLLTGTGTFVDDVTRPGMLHACFVRSPHPRARILVRRHLGSAGAARRARRLHRRPTSTATCVEAWYTGTGNTVPDTPRPPLAEGEARFAGDTVALVVADSRYLAEDAAELVDVDYEPLPAVADYASAQAIARRSCTRATRATSRASSAARPAETIADAYAGAAHVVSETIWEQAQRRGPDGDPRPGRGVVARQRRADRLGGAPRPRTRCGCSPPGCSACPSTASG